MKSKYLQVFELLDTYKSVGEVNDALGWTKSTTQHYLKRLENLGYVEKIVCNAHGHPFKFKQLVDELPEEHLANLHNRKCKHRTQVNAHDGEVNAIYNKYLFGIESAPVIEGTKILVDESKRLLQAHKDSSEMKRMERKSPRVYVGCSFGLSGW